MKDGALLEMGLSYLLLKLYNNFLSAQSNVCKTTMYSNNFNTTLNVLRCSTSHFSSYATSTPKEGPNREGAYLRGG